jgi:beta-ribofuranosylaminobenzene 5'-phosphate synthase
MCAAASVYRFAMARQSSHRKEAGSEAIEVFAPARLHLGFLDLHGGLGRRFGSIGLAIDGIGVDIAITRAAPRRPTPERARHLLARAADRLGVTGPLALEVREVIPEHVGLGSGTQLGLAIACGLAALEGRPRAARDLAPLVDRGARSGIGIGAFDQGGFLVDGGRGDGDAPAPIVARAAFPTDWRVVLIFDGERRGLSGIAETAAFGALPVFPAELAGRLCRITLLRLLPGLAEARFEAVAESIGEIQAAVGDHFAPAQGGRYASPRVAEALLWLSRSGFAGIGQSSWGPTGFVLVAGEREARRVRDALAARFPAPLSFRVCAGRNRGAEIKAVDLVATE